MKDQTKSDDEKEEGKIVVVVGGIWKWIQSGY